MLRSENRIGVSHVDVQEIAERPVINPEIIDTHLEGISDQKWVAILTIEERDALVALACRVLAEEGADD